VTHSPQRRDLIAALHPSTGRALRVGITGGPGVGKSTLIAALLTHLRAGGRRGGVVSVDPTSPFTGGAVLGDRIRLAQHFLDPGVFIRSMGSRGHLGGLASATADATAVLDAAGYDVVLVETVGAGQNEVEVRDLTETVVLALMPGAGDAIQAIKAGVMEIPDVLAICKADHPGVDALRHELRGTLSLGPRGPWSPPIVTVVAPDGVGVAELWSAVEAHRAFLDADGRLEERRREGAGRRLRAAAADRLRHALELPAGQEALGALAERVTARELDPDSALDELLSRAGVVTPAPGGAGTGSG
jgi:LAO/AO transport system kinase